MVGTPEGRFQTQFVQIAAVYLLSNLSTGFVNPYLSLHLARMGLAGAAIGLIGASIPLGGIVGPPLAASVVASRGRVGPVVSVAMAAAGVAVAAVVSMDNPWAIAALVFVYGMSMWAVAPMMDATTLALLGPRRNLYGRLRVWGSFGFMLAASTGGLFAARFDVDRMLLVAVVLLMIGAWRGMMLPSAPAATAAERSVVGGLRGFSAEDFDANFRLFVAVVVFGQMAEATQATFFAIHVDRLGLSTAVVGISWAVAVSSEMLLLWNMDKFLTRLGPRRAVVLGFGGAALRWLLTSFIRDPVLLIAVQSLHCLTFAAVYVGTVQFVHAAVPEHAHVSGQALVAGVRAGVAGVAATSLVGIMSDVWNISTLYMGSAGIAVAAAICMALLVKDPGASADAAGATDGDSSPATA